MSSPMSSPIPDELLSASALKFSRVKLVQDFPATSSPLSSPPRIRHDPFNLSSPIKGTSGGSITDEEEEEDEEDAAPPASQPLFLSSQASNGGKATLPNMKGKDLFDATIWACPVRTSVFYTFATSLRQKIKDAEPTSSHRFISHLRDRGKLVRCYTQNIDQIEEKVGLSTTLSDGPGVKGRFSRRSTANTSQLSKMVEEAAQSESQDSASTEKAGSDNESSQLSLSETPENSQTPDEDKTKLAPTKHKRDLPKSGVECVFLHGSLEQLRCFLCGKVCSWDDNDREAETLYGEQPDCPHCAGAAAERQERGKRALGVGKLRPDIVLYGEEHPSAHLISPIITNDLSLSPDLLLILGTSLRVHGLKVMVREFAKTVHSKGGHVVFVNFTKPPESIWGDIIDYWVQWDCDAWVADLEERVPTLWKDPEPKKPRQKKVKPPPANPRALQDTKVTGAYCTSKVLNELKRITGQKKPAAARRASLPSTASTSPVSQSPESPSSTAESTPASSPSSTDGEAAPAEEPAPKPRKPRARGPRKSAPGALEKPKETPQLSTLNPNHGRSRKSIAEAMEMPPSSPMSDNSILDSVKANPRRRKRKMIDGEEVKAPSVGRRRGASGTEQSFMQQAYLPPLRPSGQPFPPGRLQPMEPSSPPTGPLTSLSVNLRSPPGPETARKSSWQASGPLPPLVPMGNENHVGRKVADGPFALQSWGNSWSCGAR